MNTTASGKYIKYTDEDFKKSPEELVGKEWIAKRESENAKIKGYVKIKEYHCSAWVKECECGYDDFKRDTDFQYCPKCGEELYYTIDYQEKTPYSGCITVKGKEEAITLFYKDYGDGFDKKDIECSEMIAVWAYYFKVPELTDGYKINNKQD